KDDLIEALAVDRHRQEALLNAATQHASNPIDGLRALVRTYAQALTDPGGEPMRRVGVNGWAEALRNERVRASVIEGIDVPRSVIVAIVKRAQSDGLLSRDLSADAIASTLIAVFQGFLLQAVWKQPIDIKACTTVIDRMLAGLAPSGAPKTPRKKGKV